MAALVQYKRSVYLIPVNQLECVVRCESVSLFVDKRLAM